MPHLKYLDRYWSVAGDEFSIPAICSISVRLLWAALIIAIFAISINQLIATKLGPEIILYLTFSIVSIFFTIICEVALVFISLRGSIVEVEHRSSLGKFMNYRIGLTVIQGVCAIIGIQIASKLDRNDGSVLFAFIVILAVAQIVDASSLLCCCYLFSAGRIDDQITPRDEQTTIGLWEKSCRRGTKYAQILTCNFFGGNKLNDGFEQVAKVLTSFFHHEGFLDVVPSDIAAGIILVRLQQKHRQRKERNQPFSTDLESGTACRSEYISDDSAHSGRGERKEDANSPLLSAIRLEESSIMPAGGSRYTFQPSNPADMAFLESAACYSTYALSMYTFIIELYVRPVSGSCRLCRYGACTCFCCCLKSHSAHMPPYYRTAELGGCPTSCECVRSLLCNSCHRVSGSSEEDMQFLVGDNVCSLHAAGMRSIQHTMAHTEVAFASFHNDTTHKPYGVLIDHAKEVIVIAIRGTLSLEDCFTDVNCDPVELTSAGEHWGFNGAGRWAHGGMLRAALNIRAELENCSTLSRIYERDKTFKNASISTALTQSSCSHYPLVVTGHSLGGGTAVLLSLLLHSAYPSLRCYAFGTPAVILDEITADECASYVTTFVLGNDVVPRLTLQSLHEFRRDILQSIARARVNKMVIMQSIFRYHAIAPDDLLYAAGQEPDSEFRRNIVKFESSMKQRMDANPKPLLCLPGRIIHFAKSSSEKRCFVSYPLYAVREASRRQFQEIQVSTSMTAEHFPDRYFSELHRTLRLWQLQVGSSNNPS